MVSIISRLIKKRAIKKAFEKGSKISASGMVQVPTTSGFITVPKDSPLAGGRNGGGGSSRGGSSSGGGAGFGGADIGSENELALRLAAQARIAETERIAKESIARREAKKIEEERKRIENLRRELARKNAQRRTQTIRDSRTGDMVKVTTLMNNRTKERITTRTNLRTGKVTTRTFQRGSGGRGRIRQTGGLTVPKQESQINFNNQLNRFIKSEQAKIQTTKRKLTRIERINQFGAKITGREQQYLDSLTLKDLNRERDAIYAKIGRINSHYARYPPTTEEKYTQYQKDLAPLLARYNTYANAKKIVLKNQPEKRTSATLEFDPVLNRNVLVLSQKDRSLTKRINNSVQKLTTQIQRGGGGRIKAELLLSGVVAAQAGIGAVQGITQLPSTVKALVKNPSTIKKLPSAIKRAGAEFGVLLQISPTAAFVKLGANVYAIKITDAGFRQLSRLSSAAFVRLNPKFVGVLKAGKKLKIKTGKGKSVNLQVVNKIPGQAISKQLSLAGKKVKTAISTQADNLIGFLGKRRSKILSKPLGTTASGRRIEDALGKTASKLLKRYDAGAKLSTKQIKFLDDAIKKAGAKGLLERAFFADPTGKIRPSRLGIVKQKSLKLMDYLTGDISFKRARPQILLFEDSLIAKFPKAIRPIAKKIKRGANLTPNEYAKYTKFLNTPSGKFKAGGFISKESEIILSAGEIIKRVKKVGITRINGINIPILKVKIVKASKILKKNLDKFKAGKLTASEIRKLDKALTKATNFKYGLSSSGRAGIKYISLKRLGLSVSSRALSRKKVKRRTSTSKRIKATSKRKTFGSSRIAKRSKSSKRSKTSKRVSSPRRSKSPRSPKRIKSPKSVKSPKSPRSPKSPPKRPPTKKPPIIRIPKKFSKKQISKKVPVYFVKEKIRGRIKNLTPRPLTLGDARDFLAYRLDHNLSRSGFFEPLGKSKVVVGLPKSMRGYFRRTSKKYRPYKIRVGKKKAIRLGYIEKAKFSLDKKGEKRAIKKARRKNGKVGKKKTTIKKKRPVRRKVVRRSTTIKKKRPVRRRPKRRISPARRKQLLKQLKKARRIKAMGKKK